MLILGVVGQIASGKGILVNQLTGHFNFKSFSLSSIVHQELEKKNNQKFTRQTLQDIGDEMRKREGNSILAIKALNQLNQSSRLNQENKIVIEGIRNPAEIEFLKKNSDFILIGVKAKRELRFKRVLSRGKDWDPKTYEDFLKVDRRDLGVRQDKSGQQVGKCLAYCDFILTNNKSIKDFQKKIKELNNKYLLSK